MNPLLVKEELLMISNELKLLLFTDFKNQFNRYTFNFHASIPLFYREFHGSKRLLDVTGRLTILATKENFVKLCIELSKLTTPLHN